MSDEELDRLEALAQAATPGPWVDLTGAWNEAQRRYYKDNKEHYHGGMRGAKKVSRKEAVALIAVNSWAGEPIDLSRFPYGPDWYDLRKIVGLPMDMVYHSRMASRIIEQTVEYDDGHDRAFIAAARAAVPALVAEVRRLRTEVARLREG